MAKAKSSTKKHKVRRRIASWHDVAGDDDMFLDAMVEVTETREARVDYRLVIRERSQDGYTGNALTIPINHKDALVFAAAAAPFSTADAEKRWANEKKRRREEASG